MSVRRNSLGSRSSSVGRQQLLRMHSNDLDLDSTTQHETFPNVLPEILNIVRRLLPHELPFNMLVRNVEYIENGCERLIGTLYMTTFRLVFAPDTDTDDHHLISSGNKYIGELDIPLTSVYKINVAPVESSRSGFKSFLNENQIHSETRTFTIITRDFRNITFTNCSVTKSSTLGTKHPQMSVTKMETYIDAIRVHTRLQSPGQLYPYFALQQDLSNNSSSKVNRRRTASAIINVRPVDEDIGDFCLSNDERIKSYMTLNDWKDELYEADDPNWIVDRRKFDEQNIVKDEGPYVRLANNDDYNNYRDLIWHWTHRSRVDLNRHRNRQIQVQKCMLITVPGIGETTSAVDPVESPTSAPVVPSTSTFRFLHIKKKLPKSLRSNTTDGPKLMCTNENQTTTTSGLSALSQRSPDDGLRRAVTDSSLISSSHYICDQPFQRYNLAKFPCSLKRLQTSYEKLIEICVPTHVNKENEKDDEDKWWSRLNTSKWLKCVSKTLHGAAYLAKLLDYKNIELAGSDTDNSCLMSSLVQILLRSKSRTMKGFCELIVREWIVRGHKFRERFGQVRQDDHGYAVQESPVFLLFLDCVQQLIVQNPFLFEFTDYFLLELYRDVCYCYHHTFAFNTILERLEAISNCPKNLLLLSSFDFSLYLYANTCRLLKNDASIFNLQIFPSSPHQKSKPRVEATVVYPTSTTPRQHNGSVYFLETDQSTTPNLSIPINNTPALSHAEQFDYDTIESPQLFHGDLHVDWRTFNLVFWSQCYSRYDQNYMPPSRDQQLSVEVNSLKENIEKIRTKSKRQITLDIFQYIGHANSWHPQALDTRV